MIKPGDKLPDARVYQLVDSKVRAISLRELSKGKRMVLFALPGAFTPTCSALHLPGYLTSSDDFIGRGIDQIICLAVNDPYVMSAWGAQQGASGQLTLLADGNAEFTRAAGLQIDRSEAGMGLRSQRYSMLIEDSTVKILNLEQPGKFEVSDAATLLGSL
jgi:peroxiredoxin